MEPSQEHGVGPALGRRPPQVQKHRPPRAQVKRSPLAQGQKRHPPRAQGLEHHPPRCRDSNVTHLGCRDRNIAHLGHKDWNDGSRNSRVCPPHCCQRSQKGQLLGRENQTSVPNLKSSGVKGRIDILPTGSISLVGRSVMNLQ